MTGWFWWLDSVNNISVWSENCIQRIISLGVCYWICYCQIMWLLMKTTGCTRQGNLAESNPALWVEITVMVLYVCPEHPHLCVHSPALTIRESGLMCLTLSEPFSPPRLLCFHSLSPSKVTWRRHSVLHPGGFVASARARPLIRDGDAEGNSSMLEIAAFYPLGLNSKINCLTIKLKPMPRLEICMSCSFQIRCANLLTGFDHQVLLWIKACLHVCMCVFSLRSEREPKGSEAVFTFCLFFFSGGCMPWYYWLTSTARVCGGYSWRAPRGKSACWDAHSYGCLPGDFASKRPRAQL